MSRAFGDFCTKKGGIIALADISYHRVTSKEQFVVLASDGVRDYLKWQPIVNWLQRRQWWRLLQVHGKGSLLVRKWRIERWFASFLSGVALMYIMLQDSQLFSDYYSLRNLRNPDNNTGGHRNR
uniref:PPM-type phosphatase domain-containing protein n=1 Tax=Populus davidiana TaxID=266767 RepID=A0A6M2ER28_9ROSI